MKLQHIPEDSRTLDQIVLGPDSGRVAVVAKRNAEYEWEHSRVLIHLVSILSETSEVDSWRLTDSIRGEGFDTAITVEDESDVRDRDPALSALIANCGCRTADDGSHIVCGVSEDDARQVRLIQLIAPKPLLLAAATWLGDRMRLGRIPLPPEPPYTPVRVTVALRSWADSRASSFDPTHVLTVSLRCGPWLWNGNRREWQHGYVVTLVDRGPSEKPAIRIDDKEFPHGVQSDCFKILWLLAEATQRNEWMTIRELMDALDPELAQKAAQGRDKRAQVWRQPVRKKYRSRLAEINSEYGDPEIVKRRPRGGTRQNEYQLRARIRRCPECQRLAC